WRETKCRRLSYRLCFLKRLPPPRAMCASRGSCVILHRYAVFRRLNSWRCSTAASIHLIFMGGVCPTKQRRVCSITLYFFPASTPSFAQRGPPRLLSYLEQPSVSLPSLRLTIRQ